MRMFLMLAALPLAACQSNWEKQQAGDGAHVSGAGATRNYAASGFTSVDLRGSDDVDVKTGQNFSVVAEGDPKVLDLLDIRVVNGTLRVGRKDSKEGGWFGHNDHGARIHVVMPKLTGATVSGSGNMNVDRAEGDFGGAIAGSGNLAVAQLQAAKADLSIAGSGDLSVAGSADRMAVSIAGSGDVDATKLTAASADVSIAGSGSVHGVVKGPVSVSLIGSGDVELTGGAKCTVNSLGSGEARCS